MRIKESALKFIIMAYIYIPVFIFLAGYTRWYYAVATVAILIPCIVHFLRNTPGTVPKMTDEYDIDAYMDEDEGVIKVHILSLIISIALIVTISVLVGVGGAFPQAGDWYKHNAVLDDLTFSPWPVYYDAYDKCMLTYYLGQYMLPAAIGKFFGSFVVSNMAMTIWGIFGLILVYIYLVKITKADSVWKQIFTVFMLLFFCGALNTTQNILSMIFRERMYSLGSYHWVLIDGIMLQYRSNLVMIRWILPQVIVPWLATMLFMENIKKVQYYVLILLPTLLFGSFSFASLFFIAILMAVVNLTRKESTIRQLFSLTNILPAVSLGSILFFYFLGNIMVDKPVNSSLRMQPYTGDHIIVYLVFCFLMFGIYACCVYNENKDEPLYFINVAILLLLPWFKMGLCNDIVMSGSVPSLFILMIEVCLLIFNEKNSTSLGIRKGIAIVIILIGCIYPVRELADNIICNAPGADLIDLAPTMRYFTKRGDPATSEDLMYNYYTYDMDGQIFYEYIARTKA